MSQIQLDTSTKALREFTYTMTAAFIIILVLLGALVVASQQSALATFIYTLF